MPPNRLTLVGFMILVAAVITAAALIEPRTCGLHVYQNIAALRTQNARWTTYNSVVSVLGHTTPGDGGGGTFVLLSTDASVDDDGTVVKSRGRGTWHRLSGDEVDARWFGAVGNGVNDDTKALQAMIDSGKPAFIPAGVYRTAPLIFHPHSGSQTLRGAGFSIYNKHSGTVLIAAGPNQKCVFSFDEGANCVSLSDMRIDANQMAKECIDARYGSSLSLTNVGIFGALECGLRSRQGLLRLDRVMCTDNRRLGCELYSDSTVTNSEFSGGTVPLSLVAGGNRLTNVFANSGEECCIDIHPLNATTTNINTSIVNLYAGETTHANGCAPIIRVTGTPRQWVQQVQIANSHLVSAAANTEKIVGDLDLQFCRDIAITNITSLGVHPSAAKPSLYTTYFLRTSNCENVTVSNCVIKYHQLNPVVLTAGSTDIMISSCIFAEFGTRIAQGDQGAAIRVYKGADRITVWGNEFITTGSSRIPFAMKRDEPSSVLFTNNRIALPNGNVQ